MHAHTANPINSTQHLLKTSWLGPMKHPNSTQYNAGIIKVGSGRIEIQINFKSIKID